MNRLITFTLIFLFCTTGFSQKLFKKDPLNTKEYLELLAREQINQLQNGSLLVRLMSKNESIKALRKAGNNRMANTIEKEQNYLNLAIIDAFRNNFDFCNVYFFYSEYSQNIRNKEFDKVVFLNNNLKPDKTIKYNNEYFLTGEYGFIEQDKVKYQGGSNMSFEALIIKDDQFKQLRRPFPYYLRTFATLPIKRKPKKVVRKMNNKLKKYLEKPVS